MTAGDFYQERIEHWRSVRQRAAAAFRFDSALRARRALEFCEAGLARLAGNWPAEPVSGEEYAIPGSRDLDLIGDQSLYSQICTSRTAVGQSTLANWLQEPAPLREVLQRQEAVCELRDRTALRERVAQVEEGRGDGKLLGWANAAVEPFPSWLRLAGVLAVVLLLCVGTLALTGVVTKEVAAAAAIPELLLGAAFSARVKPVLEAITLPVLDVPELMELVEIIRGESFSSPLLTSVQESLRAADCLQELKVIGWCAEFRRNEFFMAFSYFLLWGTHVAAAAEQWRSRHAGDLQQLLQAIGTFEALNSLAAFSFEHPANVFPELIDSAEPLFESEEMGHPLLPLDICIRSSIGIGRDHPRLYIVSGSNMSGKSTFLRAIGLNAALGWAGAPVRAARLRMSRLVIGASIQVQDSLVAGTSRFLAEAKRLAWILEHSSLFLLDEILSGTNSADRRIAAEVIAHTLVDRGAVGLITSHDLALTEIPGATNIHFEHYRLCEGVVTRSNALEILRSVGILV